MKNASDTGSTGQVGFRAGPLQGSAIGWQKMFMLAVIAGSPLLSSPPMGFAIFDISSLRLYNIMPLLGVIAFLAGGRIFPGKDVLERRAYFAFLCYAAFVAFAFLRSIPNVPTFHASWPDDYPNNGRQYMLGQFLRPMLIASSFLYVLRRMSSGKDINHIVQTVSLAVAIVSFVMLAAVFYHPDALFASDPGRQAILNVVTAALGMHYNEVGTILATMAPLLLFVALKRGSYWSLPYVLALAAVLVAKSRTGIFTFAGVSIVTMIMLGRGRVLLAAAPAVGGAAVVVLGSVLIKLLTLGITQKSGLSLWLLLSGREQAIWLPVILEWGSNPLRLLFGAGAHGILTSELVSSGAFGFVAGQAHNLYLEFFVDNGIILFAMLLAAIGAWLVWAWRVGRAIQSRLYWSLYLCIVSYLVTGMSGRLYYPMLENYLLFPIMATLINVARAKLPLVAQKDG